MQITQTLARHVRVDLRCRQIAMAQQHLHHAQISAMVEQMRCKGMAHGMR